MDGFAAQGTGDEVWAEARGRSSKEGCCWASPAPGPHGSTIGGTAKRARGSAWPEIRPAARIRERKNFTGGGGWFRSELWVAAAATRVLGRRGWMGGGAGARGVFKG